MHFRQWSTRILKGHLTRVYPLNQPRFEQNAHELEAALPMLVTESNAQDKEVLIRLIMNMLAQTTFM